MRDIPWFNPRQMDDATVLALSTGRDDMLRDFLRKVRQRAEQPAAGTHWLVTGPRGAGKSYFLRLAQAAFKAAEQTATFVLLPEELPNVYAPHEWLREVERMLPDRPRHTGHTTTWRHSDELAEWETALQSLLSAFAGPLLVIGVENFDQLLAQAFETDVRASRLRTLLEVEPRIMLLATAVAGEFDENYQKRMFRQFEHHTMRRWDEQDHRLYLEKRARLMDKTPTESQLARIDAYSRYTGGSARIAAVLAAAILDEQDPVHASTDLTSTLDRMSDYYRALLERIPPNSRKLFDALVRGGEPASQMEMAERIHARQNEISRAFAWLVDYGYVRNDPAPDRKAGSYRVADRLFVQFYRMRYLEPDQPCQLTILADLLAATIEFRRKWSFAESYLHDGKPAEAELMAGLALKERNVDVDMLPEEWRRIENLVRLGEKWAYLDELGGSFAPFKTILSRISTEDDFRKAVVDAKLLASSVQRKDLRGCELAALVEGSLSLCPVEKLKCHLAIGNPEFTEEQWKELCAVFNEEKAEFEKLEAKEGPTIRKLEVKRYQTDRDFPLASTLMDLSNSFLYNYPDHLKSVTVEDAVGWAVRAVQLWIEHHQEDNTSEAMGIVKTGIRKLLDKPYQPETALRLLLPLGKLTAHMTAANAILLHELLGHSFSLCAQPDEALVEFTKGHTVALREKKFDWATWFLGQCGWTAGASGKLDQSIKFHQQAAEELSLQNSTPDQAWNLGQMARHHLILSESDKAWGIIDSKSFESPEHDLHMLQQLGDAVWDHGKSHPEAGTFAFARDILVEIAKRPRFVPWKAIQGLWIGMIDMGVPLGLLTDLLHETPDIFPETDLKPTVDSLQAWQDYLACPPAGRASHLRKLPPDLAATLEALGKEISPAARHRYGLMEIEAEKS